MCRPELDSEYLLKKLFEDITIFSNRTLDATAEERADGKFDIKLDIETHKYKADDKGNETEVPLDDWIEIGAFAKPEKGKSTARHFTASACISPQRNPRKHLPWTNYPTRLASIPSFS